MANIALYPGGYKPPHIGHYESAKKALEQADKVIVFVGPKERDGITQDISIALWKLYIQQDNIEIRKAGISPVRDVYDFVELEAKDGDTISFIKGEKDREDPRFAKIPTYAKKFNKKINIDFINVYDIKSRSKKPVSGTSMRNYIKNNDKESFIDGLPLGVDEEAAWNTVTNLEEDLYNPEDKVNDYMRSSVPGSKKDIPRAYKYKRGGMYSGGGMGFGGMYEEKGKTLHVYDFDDTIASIEVTIPVELPDGDIISVPSDIFPDVAVNLDDEWGSGNWNPDFSEFTKQISNAIVNTGVANKLNTSLSRPDVKTTILTARTIGHPVTRYLKDIGLEAYVVPLGLQKQGERVKGQDKAKWIEDHIKKGYQTIYFIDDSEENRKAVETLKDKYPDTKITVENPHEVSELMMGMMSKKEKAKHAKKMKRLKKYLKKQGNRYKKVPSFLKGTLTRKYKTKKRRKSTKRRKKRLKENYTTSAALINGQTIPLEVMDTPEKQITGMMGRNELEGGMVFPYDQVSKKDFHMELCVIPLDIVFINKDTISKIHHNCPPCNQTPCPKYSGIADNVLELPGGYCKKNNINIGDEVNLNINQQDNKVKYTLKETKMKKLNEKITKQCPAPTQDLELNTLNRNRAIQAEHIKYGPLNLSDEGYWEEYAKKWGETTSAEEAKNSNCSNCIAFDISKRMDKCMPGETTDEDGRLGYCWMHHFKCHSARTCYTWAAGGPIKDDEKSYDWQKRNKKAALDKEPIEDIQENIFTKKWWSNIINEVLLTEGGAAGHMAHPFNLPNVNDGQSLLDIFEKAADSLETNPGSVKIDGVNSSIRLVDLDGEKQFVMDRGSKKPLDIKGITKADLEDRFKPGHGMVKVGGEVLDMFNEALPSLKNDLKKLGAWEDPNILFNMEYVSGKTNVQDYGSNFIAIHGLNKIESKEVQGKRKMLTKRISSEVSYDKSALQSLLDNLEPIAKKRGYEVYGSVPTKMKKKPNFNSALSKKYTIEAGENTQIKSLNELLNELNTIPEKDFIFMNVNGTRKKVGAVSKQVYLAILQRENIDDLFEEENDKQKAIEGFTTYLATEKLGDEILKVLDSPMGSVENHEGVVIRDENIANTPFKITGKFILGGMVSDF